MAALQSELLDYLVAQRELAMAVAHVARPPAAAPAAVAMSTRAAAAPLGEPLAILQRRAHLLDQFLRSPIDLTAPRTGDSGRSDDRELLRRRNRQGVEEARFSELRELRESKSDAEPPNLKLRSSAPLLSSSSSSSSSGSGGVRSSSSSGSGVGGGSSRGRAGGAAKEVVASVALSPEAAARASRRHLYRGLSVEELDEKITQSVEALDFHEAIKLRDRKYDMVRIPPMPTTPAPRHPPPGLPSTPPPPHPTASPSTRPRTQTRPQGRRASPSKHSSPSVYSSPLLRSAARFSPSALPAATASYSYSTAAPAATATATSPATATAAAAQATSFVGASPLLEALANSCSPTSSSWQRRTAAAAVEQDLGACPRLDLLETELLTLAMQLGI